MVDKTTSLAVFKSIRDYTPKLADFVIWHGVFRSWYGIVRDYDPQGRIVYITVEGSPRILITQTEDEVEKTTYKFDLSRIKHQPTSIFGIWRNGSFSIEQYGEGTGPIWYV